VLNCESNNFLRVDMILGGYAETMIPDENSLEDMGVSIDFLD